MAPLGLAASPEHWKLIILGKRAGGLKPPLSSFHGYNTLIAKGLEKGGFATFGL
jgi:hypothetical protein